VIASGAAGVLRQLSEKAGIPVVTTLMGIGCLPNDHPNRLGMVGMHGTVSANYAVDDCDLLIAVGVRFDDRVTSGLGHKFATKAQIVHIDIDAAEIRKVVRAPIAIVGDARMVLEEMLEGLAASEGPQVADWWEQLHAWQKEYPLKYDKDRLTPQMVLECVGELTNDKTMVITDVGQHQMWTAQYFPIMQARNLVTSGGLGTMGFGLPAAMGAQIARPDDMAVLITGDGSFQMCIQELATIAHNNLPVKIFLMNNGVLGMVRQWQKMFFNRRFSGIELNSNPDFVKVAEAYGIRGVRVDSFEQVRTAIAEALAYPGPVLLDFTISPEEDVLPMVAPGKAITEMLGR
jgi:acetolactate synthase-1/2/3 large subunit